MTVCGSIDACIVDDHHVAIERAAYVELYKVSAKRDRLFNRLNCVLGCMPRCAAMSDAYHLNSCPWSGCLTQKKEPGFVLYDLRQKKYLGQFGEQ